MKILFHVGVGNTDRPERWQAICMFFTKLARVFEKLGHDCLLYCHPRAVNKQFLYKKNVISANVSKLPNFEPDKIFTWNGISDGDQQIIKLYGREKFIFGELGFFDHYETCYFDLSGTNYTSMNMVEKLDNIEFDQKKFDGIVQKYKKPRLYKNRYVFVPLQDETDTQITKLSPFKTMDALLRYVLDIYNFDNGVKIVYKQHPRRPAKVPSHPKLVAVKENVHHYIPYAENVVGVNSTVMFETLLYHQRILTVGLGIASRRFENDLDRKKFILNCYNKQIRQAHLGNVEVIRNSWLYKNLTKIRGW
jgi:hypothetical protein